MRSPCRIAGDGFAIVRSRDGCEAMSNTGRGMVPKTSGVLQLVGVLGSIPVQFASRPVPLSVYSFPREMRTDTFLVAICSFSR